MAGYLLIGMRDSPFVRRVAIALEVLGFGYENLPLRTLGDAEKFKAYSPLMRAPTLVLPNGETLFDSHLILEYLDEQTDGRVKLLPEAAAERLKCRQVTGIAIGLADKAVSAFYEKTFHPPEARNQRLLARNQVQLLDSLAWLEERAPAQAGLFGSALSHADIAVGASVCFALDAHPDWIQLTQFPKLKAWFERLAARAEFQQTYLLLDPPK